MIAFWDTNVFVYAFIAGPKQQIARRGLMSGGVISVQVLNEFTNVMSRKMRQSWEDVERFLSAIHVRFPTATPLTIQTHAAARLSTGSLDRFLRRAYRRSGDRGRLRSPL